MTDAQPSTIQPGTVWTDNRRNSRGLTIRIDRVDGEHALCTVLTNRAGARRSRIGKSARVPLASFQTGATLIGYSPATERQLAIVRELGSLDLPDPWSTTP